MAETRDSFMVMKRWRRQLGSRRTVQRFDEEFGFMSKLAMNCGSKKK